MRAFAAALMAVVVFVVAQIVAVIAEMFKTEFRTRLNQLPQALVRLAALRIPLAQRDDLRREWLAEVHRLVHGTAEELPVSSMVTAIRYALGLLIRGPAIAREFSGAKRHAFDLHAMLHRLLSGRISSRSTIGGPLSVGGGSGEGGLTAVGIRVTVPILISVTLAAALTVYVTRPTVPPVQLGPSATAPDKPIDIVILASEAGSTSSADIAREVQAVDTITHSRLSSQSWVTVIGYGGNDGVQPSQYPVSVVCRPTQIDGVASYAYLSECVRGLHTRTAAEGWNTDYAAALGQGLTYFTPSSALHLQPRVTKAILLMTDGSLDVTGDPAYPQPDWQPYAIQAAEIQLAAARNVGVHIWLCPNSGDVSVTPQTLAETLMLPLPGNCPASYLKKLLKDR